MDSNELSDIYKELQMKPRDVIQFLIEAGMDVPPHLQSEMIRHKNGKKNITKPWEAFYRSLYINLRANLNK
jgi:hypothetical protein